MAEALKTTSGSSGDLRADRRFLYAEESAAAGDHAAAAELLEQCLEIAPDWAPAWFALGVARERLGEGQAAVEAYRRAAMNDPADTLGVSLALARLGAAPVPPRAPGSYVARLFDHYAPRFDAHLIGGLGYRAPALLYEAVRDVCERMNRPMHFARALDLGCGTGLAGATFRERVDYLEGVDLSAGMIAQARAKDIYDALCVTNLADHLSAFPNRSFDLILAADVLVYIGDLEPLSAEIARVLASGGLFAFTAESHEGAGYIVGNEMRYSHSRPYVSRIINEAGFTTRFLQAAATRSNKGAGVSGLIAVAER